WWWKTERTPAAPPRYDGAATRAGIPAKAGHRTRTAPPDVHTGAAAGAQRWICRKRWRRRFPASAPAAARRQTPPAPLAHGPDTGSVRSASAGPLRLQPHGYRYRRFPAG